MARKGKAAKSAKLTLPHVPAPNFKVATADGANVTVVSDGVGVTVHVTFTRIEVSPISETFPIIELVGGVQQSGPPEFETPPRKVQEFGVLLRPDHAFRVAELLLRKVSELDDAAKKRYEIPEVELVYKKSKKK